MTAFNDALHLLGDAVFLVVCDWRSAVVRLIELALLDAEVGRPSSGMNIGGVDAGGQNVLFLVDVLEEEPLIYVSIYQSQSTCTVLLTLRAVVHEEDLRRQRW